MILISGFATLITLMQNIMMYVLPFPEEELTENSDMMDYVFYYSEIIVAVFLLIAIWTLISSIGLLKRKNWARISMICIFIFAIVWTIFSSSIQWFYFFDTKLFDFSGASLDIPSIIATVILLIMIITLTVLFIWLIKKLTSQNIKNEFQKNVPQHRI
tara:strand:- start:74 stop:547 length:474 start_codon:yes stop_codon:yes gene_type:complete